jgi:hypothetical protein
MIATAKRSAIAIRPCEARTMLEKATSVNELRNLETYFKVAFDLAKEAKCGRKTMIRDVHRAEKLLKEPDSRE